MLGALQPKTLEGAELRGPGLLGLLRMLVQALNGDKFPQV